MKKKLSKRPESLSILKTSIPMQRDGLDLRNIKSIRHKILFFSDCTFGRDILLLSLSQWLASQFTVGILDLDIKHSSLFAMFVSQSEIDPKSPNLTPLHIESGLTYFSLSSIYPGNLSQKSTILETLVKKILLGTRWGNLDFLLVNLPIESNSLASLVTKILGPSTYALIHHLEDLPPNKPKEYFAQCREANCPILGFVDSSSHFACDFRSGGRNDSRAIALARKQHYLGRFEHTPGEDGLLSSLECRELQTIQMKILPVLSKQLFRKGQDISLLKQNNKQKVSHPMVGKPQLKGGRFLSDVGRMKH